MATHILYFLDKDMNMMWNTSDQYNDTHVMGIDLGSSTFTFEMNKNDVYNINALSVNNFVVMKDFKDNTWAFTILEVEDRQDDYRIHCENLGLELLNRVCDKWPKQTSKTFAQYFAMIIGDADWKIGINEISTLTRSIEYDSRETALKRMLSVLNTFGAEIDFTVKFELGKITEKIANIYLRRGVDRTAVQLVYNENLNGITKTSEIRDFCTALAGVSDGNGPANAKGEATDLYLGDKDREYIDPKSGYKFVSKKGDKYIRCEEANDAYGRHGNYVEAWYESQAKTADALFTETCLQLANRIAPRVNYELNINDFDPSLNLGDTIKIIDHDFRPALYLQARLLQLEICYTDESQNKALFGNFEVLNSSIELKIFKLQDRLNALQLQSGDTYFPSVAYANDINGADFTTDVTLPRKYMAIIYQLNNPINSTNPDDYAGKWKLIQGSTGTPGANGKTYYTWIMYADNVSGGGISASPTNKKYVGISYNNEVETPSTDPTKYQWALMKGDKGDKGDDGDKGDKGDNGQTSYTHYAWADNPTGTVGFTTTQSSGKKYMGVYSDFTPTGSTNPTAYKWVDLANSMVFGVRNLLLNSSFAKNSDQWSFSNLFAPVYNGEYVLMNKTATQTTRATISQNVLNRLNGSTEYTLSGKYYIESASGANAQSSTIFLRTSDGVQTPDTPIHNIDFSKTGEWITFSATGTSRPNTLTSASVTVAISGDMIVKMRLKELKLERGNKMTDWSPAPEDTDASLLALNNALANAKYPIVSQTQPATGIEGQQWWKVDANGNVVGYFVYTGGVWKASKIDQSSLVIVSLSAVDITGSEITGTTIKSSTMEITGNYVDQGATIDYTTSINGPIAQTWKVRGTDQHGAMEILPTRINSASYMGTASTPATYNWQWEVGGGGFFIQYGAGTGNAVDRAGMTHTGIQIYSKKYSGTYGIVNLKYEDLLNIDFTTIPPSSFSNWFKQYSTSGANIPQCARFGRTVQLRGAITPVNTIDASNGATQQDMCQLPRWAWPATEVNQIMQASGSNSYLLTVKTDGRLYFARHMGWLAPSGNTPGSYGWKDAPNNAWLNISMLYTAGDLP